MDFDLSAGQWPAATLLTAALILGGLLSVWLRRRGDLTQWAVWFSVASWAILLVAVATHADAARAAAAGLVAGGFGTVLAEEAASSLRHPTR